MQQFLDSGALLRRRLKENAIPTEKIPVRKFSPRKSPRKREQIEKYRLRRESNLAKRQLLREKCDNLLLGNCECVSENK